MSNYEELTTGERLVGIGFNVGGDAEVAACKRRFADAIDQLETHKETANELEVHGETANEHGTLNATKEYLLKEAQTRIIDAQMWAVKALTYGK